MLRTYEIKLNLSKCLFGAKSGCFLGYIITERDIEANPSKVKALQDMPPPQNLKEAQRLTSRITTLSRFISKSFDRSLPFFKMLRRATKFQWDAECDRALEELKEYLNSLSVLAKPIVGEPLWIYLSSNEHIVGSAFVRQNGQDQQPCPGTSPSQPRGIEKANQMDDRAERVRHSVSLVIKAQALANFVIEVQSDEPVTIWRIYVDDSSTRQGSGIDILLISPRENWMQLSIRLDYRAINNEAEYETLIASLQAARHMGAIKVLIHSNSQLAAQQLSRTFEISNAQLRLYAEAFEKLKVNFQEPIEQVSLVVHINWIEGITFPNDWRTALTEFLRSGVTPADPKEARLLKKRARQFTLIGDQLYKRAFSRLLLKCVRSEGIEYILKEVHQGFCGGHLGGRALARKILLAEYFWLTLQEDAAQTMTTCLSC
ncbi:uncharacterized protein LOC122019550 [Zingiber officinale]|uniref:uncharacterized protein LOC122019550 n=1 Tax=Zingiber officinale TaxID=94328 RepID=UPI001C4BF414|nr:uncharacterized protein LOC122019550 [Zingiber officinale]